MKKLFAILMSAVMVVSFAACSRKEEPAPAPSEPEESTAEVREESLWDDATYTEDVELGEGSKIVNFTVSAEGKTVNFKIHTDAETLDEALVENDLVEGSDSEYGLMVDTVDGMYADYNATQQWWGLYVDGEMSQVGVSSVELDEETDVTFELSAA
ncbi:MAG: DUF4430 domain-containing protein [Oscillospiraceae bacterium]|nr:DUF4430 domain-containing protein [Oscillospiraceae bacterium]